MLKHKATKVLESTSEIFTFDEILILTQTHFNISISEHTSTTYIPQARGEGY